MTQTSSLPPSHPIIVIPMACDQSTTFHIDHEWAESLKGLRMNVPDNWWDGFTGHKLNGGVIAHVDFGIDGNKYFQLELDGECSALPHAL